jgi:hypothetical protein
MVKSALHMAHSVVKRCCRAAMHAWFQRVNVAAVAVYKTLIYSRRFVVWSNALAPL